MPTSILLSGACATGKATLMTVGDRTLNRHVGRTATMDADTVRIARGEGRVTAPLPPLQ